MPPPSPHLSLLDRRVHLMPFTGDVGDVPANIQRRVLTSGDKLAFGFVEDDEANLAAMGLELEVQFADDTGLSFLTLQGSDQHSGIQAIDKNLILIASGFRHIYPGDVLLIYDTIDSSLHMIPSKPYNYRRVFSARLLVARRHKDGDDNHGDNSYALVYLGALSSGRDVLFLSLSSTSPWTTTKNVKFTDKDHLLRGKFFAEEAFSFRGRCYWVDLMFGVLYCDCNDVLSDDMDCVDIGFLNLPVECKHSGYKDELPERRIFRAMGPVGDSIKFVSIDGHIGGDILRLSVWRLMEDMDWVLERVVDYASLLKHKFKMGWVPMYPFLSTEEDDAIYFALGSNFREPRCIVRLDLFRNTTSITDIPRSQFTPLAGQLAVSRNVLDKLLKGSCQASHVEDLKPYPSLARERHLEGHEYGES